MVDGSLPNNPHAPLRNASALVASRHILVVGPTAEASLRFVMGLSYAIKADTAVETYLDDPIEALSTISYAGNARIYNDDLLLLRIAMGDARVAQSTAAGVSVFAGEDSPEPVPPIEVGPVPTLISGRILSGLRKTEKVNPVKGILRASRQFVGGLPISDDPSAEAEIVFHPFGIDLLNIRVDALEHAIERVADAAFLDAFHVPGAKHPKPSSTANTHVPDAILVLGSVIEQFDALLGHVQTAAITSHGRSRPVVVAMDHALDPLAMRDLAMDFSSQAALVDLHERTDGDNFGDPQSRTHKAWLEDVLPLYGKSYQDLLWQVIYDQHHESLRSFAQALRAKNFDPRFVPYSLFGLDKDSESVAVLPETTPNKHYYSALFGEEAQARWKLQKQNELLAREEVPDVFWRDASRVWAPYNMRSILAACLLDRTNEFMRFMRQV